MDFDYPEEKTEIEDSKSKQRLPQKIPLDISAESVETVRQELSELLRLMNFKNITKATREFAARTHLTLRLLRL